MLTNPEVHHETSDIGLGAVLGAGLGLIVAGIAIHFGIWLLFMFFTTREARSSAPQYPLAVGQERRLPPEPRLQTNPRQDLRDLRAEEDALLGSYGWVDEKAGIVRIPIDEAMKLAVQRGLPTRQASENK